MVQGLYVYDKPVYAIGRWQAKHIFFFWHSIVAFEFEFVNYFGQQPTPLISHVISGDLVQCTNIQHAGLKQDMLRMIVLAHVNVDWERDER